MPSHDSENQWEKLFEHLNYCISILKKNIDEQKLEIFKRVQHDVQLLQKYIKSITKYNEKRQAEFQKLIKQLKKKDIEAQNRQKQLQKLLKHKIQLIESQNSKILELSSRIQRNEQQITKKQVIIQHLKYSKNIDASYVSSVLINGNSSVWSRENAKMQKNNPIEETGSIDCLNLSEYSEQNGQQKIDSQIKSTSTRSQVRDKLAKRASFVCGIINEQQQNSQQRAYSEIGQSKELHKASSLIFND